jgi:hypothetical protein
MTRHYTHSFRASWSPVTQSVVYVLVQSTSYLPLHSLFCLSLCPCPALLPLHPHALSLLAVPGSGLVSRVGRSLPGTPTPKDHTHRTHHTVHAVHTLAAIKPPSTPFNHHHPHGNCCFRSEPPARIDRFPAIKTRGREGERTEGSETGHEGRVSGVAAWQRGQDQAPRCFMRRSLGRWRWGHYTVRVLVCAGEAPRCTEGD